MLNVPVPIPPPGTIHPAEVPIRDAALALPEATEEFPWEHRAFKVRGKVFLFLSADDSGLGLSLKLPTSQEEALRDGNAKPTGYGLGKSGWVSLRYAPDTTPPLETLLRYMRESYVAVAPKKLGRSLSSPPGAP